MEDNLTLEELNLLLEMKRRQEDEDRKFLAGVNGIDLDKNSDEETSFEEIKRKADAALAGMTEEEYFFDIVGIEVESDEED